VTKKKNEAAEPPNDAIAGVLDGLKENDEGVIDAGKESPKATPDITDPEWQDYVLAQFAPNEMDEEGRPYVHGLRRVARKLLGPVLKSGCRVVRPPVFVDGLDKAMVLAPTTVEYEIIILWAKPEKNGPEGAYEVSFSDCASVYLGNCDPFFARYAPEVASTRAEARCYRKALGLRKIAAEENTTVGVDDAAADGLISPTQINFIDVLSKRCGIDAMKFINSGKSRYRTVNDVPYGVAALMVQKLSSYQNEMKSIPADIKGYKPNWRNG
jgi:hypothetical protein